MINTDKEFKVIVYNIANCSAGTDSVLAAKEYLWRRDRSKGDQNWDRLKETPHGRFLRECSECNPCPDLILRCIYRNEVLEDTSFSE